jgi:hypothetical protein
MKKGQLSAVSNQLSAIEEEVLFSSSEADC